MIFHSFRASTVSKPAVRRRAAVASCAAALLLAVPLLSACSSSDETSGSQSGSVATEATASALTLEGGWAKAGQGMSGVFGTLVNHTGEDIVLDNVSSDVAAVTELHESITSGGTATMRQVEDGFTIAAGETFELEPGGNHIMLMELHRDLLAGDEVTVTLGASDGTKLEATVLVKDFAGAEENYDDIEPEHADH